jgi:hypothetical protein
MQSKGKLIPMIRFKGYTYTHTHLRRGGRALSAIVKSSAKYSCHKPSAVGYVTKSGGQGNLHTKLWV